MKSLLKILLAGFWLALLTPASAYPPAPYYTIYGVIRDQVGQTITAADAVVVLQVNGAEIARTPITALSGPKLDHNYELQVRLDDNRTGTKFYTSKAVAVQGRYGIVVLLNGVQYAPIEAKGGLTAGKGGERVKLDLDLGISSANDGIPDAWKEWQLYQAGYYPDANGNWPLSLITASGDFNHSGVSNYQQYLAGTFVGDSQFKFFLNVKQASPAGVSFQFYGITGKTYTIDRSTDLKKWTQVTFSAAGPLSASNAGDTKFTATSVGLAPLYAAPSYAATKEFYRLTVR